MRNSVEKWLQNIWYSDDMPPWYLRMLVPLYRAGYRFDHRQSKTQKSLSSTSSVNSDDDSQSSLGSQDSMPLNPAHPAYPSKPEHSFSKRGAPVLVVGNITIGGSGKTPLVIALCIMARELGFRVGVASTGYGRKSTATTHVGADCDTAECGDEPVLIALRTGCPVIVASQRSEAIVELDKLNLDLIISDDGLQTAGLRRDIEICVVDGARGIGNKRLLPAGPLREPGERLQLVDRVISNGDWPSKPGNLDVSTMKLVGDEFVSIDGTQKLQSAEFFGAYMDPNPNPEVHLFAAIGNPDRFFTSVRNLDRSASKDSKKIKHWHEHRFADHHAYTVADFDGVPDGATIVMTEKDAVKCRRLNLKNAWYLPVNAELDDSFVQWYRQQLLSLKQDKP